MIFIVMAVSKFLRYEGHVARQRYARGNENKQESQGDDT
jgi:hypothetical protein